MQVIVKLILLPMLTMLVTGEAPDCGIRNQFNGYCFSLDYCNDFVCASDTCGQFPKNIALLKIRRNKIIPQCAITNSTTLKTVSGINSNIHVLASGSFAYLPNVESILLPYNLIRELHHGIFYYVNVELIDLSWNKIIYISEGAFKGVTGLKYLNLSKNELSTIPVTQLPNMLMEINLSHNFLEELALYGARQPDLTSIDISHNNLERVALSFDNPLKKLDLSNNRLESIDFYDINDCENLKIPSNMFSKVPQFLVYSRIRRVALHPNPWKCDQLQRLWLHLENNNVEEEKPNNTESQPLCTINTDQVLSRSSGNDLECDDDTHCSEHLLCRAHKCLNPCNDVCHNSNICQVSHHQIECLCPGIEKKNPHELFSRCYDVECFSNSDCQLGKYCTSNKTCNTVSFGSATSGGYGGGGGFGGYEPFAGGNTGYNYPPGGGSGSSSSERYPDYPPPRPVFDISPPGNGGSTTPSAIPQEGYAGSSYGTYPQSTGGSSGYGAPSYGNHQPGYAKPWWFNDIPKLTPTHTIFGNSMSNTSLYA